MTAIQPTSTPDLARACAEHTAYLRARLRGLGVAEASLDDAVQDVFEVLVRRLGDFDSRFSLRQWMAGVARRIARRHRERALRTPEPVDEAEHASSGLDPERWASRQEALAVVRSFLEQLDADRWAVFVLSEIEGLRGTEIAAELDVNLSTVYARLRTAKQAFERALSEHRRRERRSWFVLPFFGLPSPTRRAGAMAFTTPVLLVTLGAMSLGGVLAARGCSETAPAPDAVASGSALAPAAALPASGVQPREVDPPTIAGTGRAAASEGPAPAERDGWIAAGYGFHEGGPNFYDEPRFRLEGSDLVIQVEYIGDDDVPTQGLTGWVEPEGLVVVEGREQWPLDLAAGERRIVTVRLRAVREGLVEVALWDGDPERRTGGARHFRLIHEQGRLRRCGPDECPRTASSVRAMLSGTQITVNLHNTCDQAIEVLMLPGALDRPPVDAPTLRLAAGERRSVSVDTALGFSRRTEDGRLSGFVQTDAEGALVRFSGEGCATFGVINP